jgi:hypothetical protein
VKLLWFLSKHLLTFLVRFFFPTFIYAQEFNDQSMGSSNYCSPQLEGDNNIVYCSPYNAPLSEEKKNDLSDLCMRENFGKIDKILIKTKATYKVGEIISIEYAGACPGKTVFFIVSESAKRDCRRNTGMRRRSETAQSYEGSLEFNKHKIGKAGKYVIHACFLGEGDDYMGGVSLPFEVLKRF